MDANGRSGRLRSFVLGGLVGASAAIAAARRLGPPRRRETPAGLAAFEEAPCFRETLEQERRVVRPPQKAKPPLESSFSSRSARERP